MANTQVPSELIATNAISGTIIADNAITSVHIAQNQVTAVQIPDGSITATQIAADAVGATELAASSVVTASIQDDQVTGDKLTNNITVAGTLAAGSTITSGSHVIIPATSRLYLDGSGDTFIEETSANEMTFTTQNSERVRIDADGKVGIGTNDPDRLLTLQGDNSYMWIKDAGGGNVGFIGGSGENDGLMRLYKGDHNAKVEIHSDADSYFNGGSVGIGTSSPTNILHTSTSSNNVGRFESTDATAYIRINDTDDSLYVTTAGQKGSFGANASVHANNLNIDLTNGNVGIGTTSPTAPLTVSYSGTGNLVELISTDTGSSTAPDLSLYRNSSSPADDDNIGLIRFYGNDDGGNKTSYASIHALIGDASDGTSDGMLIFSTTRADTQAPTAATESMRIFETGDQRWTGGQDLYFRMFADSGSSQGSASILFESDGTSDRQNLASILMQQESGAGSAQKGEMYFKVSDNGSPATAIKIANNKDTEVFGRLASYYDGNNHVAIRGLNGGQYIQYSSSSALKFMSIDTYPNSGASHVMSLSGGKVRIGSDSPPLAGILSVVGGNAGVPALFVQNTNADSVGLRAQVANNNAGNYIIAAYNTDGIKWNIRNDGDHQGTDTSIGSISDSRLKKDVTDLTYDIAKFKQYRPVEFNWINPELHKSVSGKSRGFLAQEVKALDEYYVDKYDAEGDDVPLVDSDGKAHSTKFGYKDAMYISVIKQLITRLETAEAKIAVLEG